MKKVFSNITKQAFKKVDHVFTIKAIVDKYFGKNQKLYFSFGDFRKAYVSIWRKRLFYKLYSYRFSEKYINLPENIYKITCN